MNKYDGRFPTEMLLITRIYKKIDRLQGRVRHSGEFNYGVVELMLFPRNAPLAELMFGKLGALRRYPGVN